MWYVKLVIFFLICAFALAAKDLLIKYLFNSGILFNHIIFYTGLFSLIISLLFSLCRKEKFAIVHKKYQFWRIIIVSLSAFFVFLSFQLLCPSIVNIGSKMTLPLMILLSSFLALPYGKKEKYLALLTLAIMFIFFYQALYCDNTSRVGLLILLISTFCMIGEYMTLSHTVKKESSALICSIPSVSLILLGISLSFVFNEPLWVLNKNTFFLLLCGLSYFIAYYSGIIRYKLLPPGLAEYPSLMSIFFIWPVDVFFYRGVFPSIHWLLD